MTSLRVVPQRNSSDCAIAALASLANLPYEDVLIAAARIAPCEQGMYLPQIAAVAGELGISLKLKRRGRYDLDRDTGILHVASYRRDRYHVCILWEGRVIDTDGSLYLLPSEYLAAHRWKPGSLLVLEDL